VQNTKAVGRERVPAPPSPGADVACPPYGRDIAGRNPRLVGDPSLAHPHKAGATVHLAQILVHEQLGAISVHGPFRVEGMWSALYDEVGEAFGEFVDIGVRLEALPVGPDAMRAVDDEEFVATTYRAATRAVVGAVLALQHLTAEIGFILGLDLDATDLDARLRRVAPALGFESHATIEGWHSVHELEQLRHAIEHPSAETLYSADWDGLPRAWIFSDKPLKASEGYRLFFDSLAERWLEVPPTLPTQTVTIGAVRGAKSTLPAKRPPKAIP